MIDLTYSSELPGCAEKRGNRPDELLTLNTATISPVSGVIDTDTAYELWVSLNKKEKK